MLSAGIETALAAAIAVPAEQAAAVEENRGYRDIAELLIAKGADVNAKDNKGGTTLSWAQAATKAAIAEKGKQLEAFVLGYAQGQAWARANRAEAAKIATVPKPAQCHGGRAGSSSPEGADGGGGSPPAFCRPRSSSFR